MMLSVVDVDEYDYGGVMCDGDVCSTYLQYRATGDASWLQAGRLFLSSLETHTRVACGFAAVQDVNTRELANVMPSFFLSETCKYLYLLFDQDNFVHRRAYIFR